MSIKIPNAPLLDTESLVVRVPVKLSSVNRSSFGMSRDAAYARAREIRNVRETTRVHVMAVRGRDLRIPTAVHLVRVSPRRLDDDNLISGAKACIDGIADALRVNDRVFVVFGDRRGIQLSFGQRTEGPGVFAVIIELRFSPRGGQ